jgi:hypothetical protein
MDWLMERPDRARVWAEPTKGYVALTQTGTLYTSFSALVIFVNPTGR